jgi:hypothetical protein
VRVKPVSLPKTATVARTSNNTPAAQVARAAPIASAPSVAGGAATTDVDETRVPGAATAYVKPAATPDRVQTLLQAKGAVLGDLDDLVGKQPLALRRDARRRVAFARVFEGNRPLHVRIERRARRAGWTSGQGKRLSASWRRD